MYLLVLVLDDPAHLEAVLDAWTQAGVPGITVLDSTGVRRLQQRASQQDRPSFLGFSRLLRTDEHFHNTLFAVVEELETIERAAAATVAIVGDLAEPHTGFMFTLPVDHCWGLPKRSHSASSG